MMQSTYTNGLSFKCKKDITKNDLVNLCKLLDQKLEGINFRPEPISEGGIVYGWKNDSPNEWYKSVRFERANNWGWINDNVMTEWLDNDDIVFNKESRFDTFLKSFHGAPLFTIQELQAWEECFNEIGIIRFGRYPSRKKLITTERILGDPR